MAWWRQRSELLFLHQHMTCSPLVLPGFSF
jgi:hypothetical protein